MWTVAFWKATTERAVKTFAQTLGALLVAGVSFADVPWDNALSVSGVATLASVLTSVVGANIGTAGPSLANEVVSPPAPHIEAVE